MANSEVRRKLEVSKGAITRTKMFHFFIHYYISF